mmetsp:Transcript_26119/g.46433  ORF Transcript_26119/g.46433 Transcript_26119/m.46433 type:complete len:1304 (-) Transcript_26119:98-4009(-)
MSKHRAPSHVPKSLAMPATVESDQAALVSVLAIVNESHSLRTLAKLESVLTRLDLNRSLASLSEEHFDQLNAFFKASLQELISLKWEDEPFSIAKALELECETIRIYIQTGLYDQSPKKFLDEELLEQSLDRLKVLCEDFLLKLSRRHPSELAKWIKRPQLTELITSISNLLKITSTLISRGRCQDYWIVGLNTACLQVLFCRGLELLQFPLSQVIIATCITFEKLRTSILEEVVTRLPELAEDPDKMLSSKSKLHSRLYMVSDGLSIHFASYFILALIQHSCQSLDQYEDSTILSHYLVCNLLQKSQQSDEFRAVTETIMTDCLALCYRPEFPSAHKLIGLFVAQLLQITAKQTSANLRHFAIDKLAEYAKAFRRDLKAIREKPLNLRATKKGAKTEHPSDDPSTSACICEEGWNSDKKGNMVQCERCYFWFHLNCVGLDLDRFHGSSWYCDDCLVLNSLKLKPVKVTTPTVEVLPPKITSETLVHFLEFQELINNFLLQDPNLGHARHYFLALSFFQAERSEKPTEAIENFWHTTSDQTSMKAKLSEKGTEKLIQQMLACTDIGYYYIACSNKIMNLLSSSQPLTRSRALKALAGIVDEDPLVLLEKNTGEAVQARLHDSAISVREACVDLIGRYIGVDLSLFDQFLGSICERLKDKGMTVRKRAVQIMQRVLVSHPEHPKAITIQLELLQRLQDEAESIKEAAAKTLQQLWFSESNLLERYFLDLIDAGADPDLMSTLLLQVPDVELLKALVAKLTESLAKAENFKTIVRGLNVISKAQPSLLVKHIKTLHIFLSPDSWEDEDFLCDMCNILERSAAQQQGSISLYNAIQKQLLDLVYRCGTAVTRQALQALVSSVCNITQQYAILTDLVQKCYILLNGERKSRTKARKASLLRGLFILGYLTRLFEYEMMVGFELEDRIKFSDTLFNILSFYCRDSETDVRERAFEAMSYVWTRYPRMLYESSDLIEEAWDNATSSNSKLHLLITFKEFLAHSDLKIAEQNTQDLGNSLGGVLNHLRHLYIQTKDESQSVREAASEVLDLLIQQGLTTPAITLPHIIGLLADTSTHSQQTALKCLQGLLGKSMDLVLVGLSQGAREAFEVSSVVRQVESDSMNKLFVLMKGKKSARIKFIATLCKLVEVPDCDFTMYVCVQLAGLSYSTRDELASVHTSLNFYLENRLQLTLAQLKQVKSKRSALDEVELKESLLTAQILILRQCLSLAYQVDFEDTNERPIVHTADTTSFLELYSEFRGMHSLQSVKGEQLSMLKTLIKVCAEDETSRQLKRPRPSEPQRCGSPLAAN